jgi:hypothetical protein
MAYDLPAHLYPQQNIQSRSAEQAAGIHKSMPEVWSEMDRLTSVCQRLRESASAVLVRLAPIEKRFPKAAGNDVQTAPPTIGGSDLSVAIATKSQQIMDIAVELEEHLELLEV